MRDKPGLEKEKAIVSSLCEELRRDSATVERCVERYQVMRGLRHPDGTGVLAGLTTICNVHGYLIDDGVRIPDQGRLTYRGIPVTDLVAGCAKDNRFGFEETVWLLLFGRLPSRSQLENFSQVIAENRELPPYFTEEMIIKAPSPNLMNKMARSILALYSYDADPEDGSLENNVRQSIRLIARMPTIMTGSYQVKRRHYDKESMFFHPLDPGHSTAEAILYAIRPDRQFTTGGSPGAGYLPDSPCGARRRQQFHLYLPGPFFFGNGYLFCGSGSDGIAQGPAAWRGQPESHRNDGRSDGPGTALVER